MRRHAKAIVAISATLLILALGATVAGAIAPSVTVENAENVDYTTADVKGTVDPGDKETSFHFEAATEADFSNVGAFTGFGSLGAGGGSQPVGPAEFTGLKPGTTYHLRLVAENEDGPAEAVAASTFTTDALALPSVTINLPTAITEDSAHFSGTINPNAPGGNPDASDVKWHFECTPECPGLPAPQTIEADASDHEVEADASGLDPNTSYEVRLIATNAGGQQSASDATTFSTSTTAPLIKPLDPAVITDTSAWIGALINPQNSPTTYYLEYSTDEDFATSVKVPASEDASAGSGNSFAFFNHRATGLQPGATYYYRAVATGAGTTEGEASSFTTRALPLPSTPGLPDGRVYERVSPVEKNSVAILAGGGGIGASAVFGSVAKAAENGDGVAFASLGSFAGEGAPYMSQYLARRGPTGWTVKGISPAQDSREGTPRIGGTYWLSNDLSSSVALTPAALNEADSEGVLNLYWRNNSTDTYTNLAPFSSDPWYRMSQATADGQHVIFETGFESAPKDVWEWSPAGGVRRVSVLPGDSPVQGFLGGGREEDEFSGGNAISSDGANVYFSILSSTGSERLLYLRDFSGLEATTIPVSASERAGDDPYPGEPREARFELASTDGSSAFFRSPVSLTDETPADLNRDTLYRWQRDADPGERLTDLGLGDPDGEPDVRGTVGASDDATAVYFVATGVLAPGAVKGAANLYLWRQGQGARLVATLLNDESNQGRQEASVWARRLSGGSLELSQAIGVFRQARVSPDGRYLAFASPSPLTAYDTNGTRQVYLYDSQADRLSCISCSSLEPRSTASSALTSFAHFVTDDPRPCCNADWTGYLPRNLASDGSYLVFDSAEALVPTDSNGTTDVYMWRDGEARLISSGESREESKVLDVSADGADIFFTTTETLVASDVDTDRDVYDARVDGRPEPAVQPRCIADECQGTPAPPPTFGTPNSANYKGQGNQASRPRCGKAKVRRNGRCVQKHKRKKAKKTNKSKQGRNH